jgi:hypothetical protein
VSANSNAVNELNAALTTIKAAATFISLHTGNPGTTGANEVVGGSYIRVATTWGTVSGGSMTGSQVTINVPAGTTITNWGLWSTSTAGNYYDGGALPTGVLFSVAGTYLITVTLTAG